MDDRDGTLMKTRVWRWRLRVKGLKMQLSSDFGDLWQSHLRDINASAGLHKLAGNSWKHENIFHSIGVNCKHQKSKKTGIVLKC